MVKTNRLRSGESQSKQRKIIALPDQKKKKKKKKQGTETFFKLSLEKINSFH